MRRLAQLCESIAATTKKNEKVALVAGYLRTAPVDESALAALYLCGRVFPRREERVLAIGFSLLLRAVAKIANKNPADLSPILRHHGDLGASAEEILRHHPVRSSLTLPQIAEVFASLAQQRGPSAKQALLEHTLRRLSALEAKYFIKIATGELRIGLKESLVEEAIAKAFDQTVPAVQRANMLVGDITDVLRLAIAGRLSSVQLKLFRPISAMLASPAETAADLVAAFPNGPSSKTNSMASARKSTSAPQKSKSTPAPSTASPNSQNFSIPSAASPEISSSTAKSSAGATAAPSLLPNSSSASAASKSTFSPAPKFP